MAAKYTLAQALEVGKLVAQIMASDHTISLENAVTLADRILDAVAAIQA